MPSKRGLFHAVPVDTSCCYAQEGKTQEGGGGGTGTGGTGIGVVAPWELGPQNETGRDKRAAAAREGVSPIPRQCQLVCLCDDS